MMITLQLYEMACTCGQSFYAEASSREEAVHKIWHEMGGNGLARHMRRYHPGESVPAPHEVYQMIEERLAAVM